MKMRFVAVAMLAAFAATAFADKNEGKGQGAFIIVDTAYVYTDSEGDRTDPGFTLSKGDVVAGFEKMAGMAQSYQFENQNGRVRVLALNKKGQARNGWMNRSDLSAYFTYECGCGLVNAKCSPHVLERFHYKWNICFEEGRDNALAKQNEPVAQTRPAPAESPETRLQKLNDLFKKGVITKEEYEAQRAAIIKSM